jgi:hypothetical protein
VTYIRVNFHPFCDLPNGSRGDVWVCDRCGQWWIRRAYAWHKVTGLGRWWINRRL